ncbi:uncharacterized protein LOC101854568 [Aplysia californica]|uniref:Uncharacterized protein LOC101854568 n=1 Tax=Aplysia californica TaxID=6500 RepID=A0ABM0JNA7_APLCA|nr:uncharacterized protein LOC101854568 [Aplysia californica]
MAFVWLQAKPNEANGLVEIFCGQSLQDLLDRIRHQFESRHREETKKQADDDDISKIEDEEENNNNTSTLPAAHSTQTLNSDLAAIVGGIVVAGFILIAAVIIALALHCRRMRREKLAAKPLEMYPAVNSEPLDLASYCRYDYDDDHLCSINRSPKKMAALADEEDREHRRHLQGHSDDDSDPAAAHLRPNGFVTVATTEDYHLHRDPTPSPPFPAGLSTPPPSAQNQPLLSAGGKTYREVHYPGDLSLRFVKPIVKEDPNQGDGGQNTNTMNTNGVYSYNYNPYPPPPPPVGFEHQGHTTLPANRKAVLINTGPKSPLGKRSKSVTFSQPVAMVTPLNSESEESMESGSLKQQQPPLKQQHYDDEEEPNYDNLNQLDIPDSPVMPGKPELIKIPRWDKEYREESPMRPLSTFQNSPSPPPHEVKVIIAPPPTDLNLQPQLDDHKSGSAPPFWSPTKQTGKPMVMPKPQKAHLYETGV